MVNSEACNHMSADNGRIPENPGKPMHSIPTDIGVFQHVKLNVNNFKIPLRDCFYV